MTDYVHAIKHLSNGFTEIVNLPISDLAQEFGYSNGNLIARKVFYQDTEYAQTLTYTNGNVTAISQWESIE